MKVFLDDFQEVGNQLLKFLLLKLSTKLHFKDIIITGLILILKIFVA